MLDMSMIRGRDPFDRPLRRRADAHPGCDYPFFVAQRLALAEWHAWAAAQATSARLLALAGAPVARRSRITAVRAWLGVGLIALGRRVQGVPMPRTT
jgi:hypothetical protein